MICFVTVSLSLELSSSSIDLGFSSVCVVIMSSEEVVEVTVVKAAEASGGKLSRRKMRKKDAVDGGGDGLVKWERFLPKIALRVLLVEADDSTRQIISALLRKCSYRGQFLVSLPEIMVLFEHRKIFMESENCE